MEYIEYRAYCHKDREREHTICKFWVCDDGEIDLENLPGKRDTAALLQAMRAYEIYVEPTGKVQNE